MWIRTVFSALHSAFPGCLGVGVHLHPTNRRLSPECTSMLGALLLTTPKSAGFALVLPFEDNSRRDPRAVF
jgi:hypothetical protein